MEKPFGSAMNSYAAAAYSGGGGGIRTPETLTGLTVFKTAAFNHSATPPLLIIDHLSFGAWG